MFDKCNIFMFHLPNPLTELQRISANNYSDSCCELLLIHMEDLFGSSLWQMTDIEKHCSKTFTFCSSSFFNDS